MRLAAGALAVAIWLAQPAAADERTRHLEAGEAALARGDAQGAIAAFDRAGAMAHAPDTEIGLVRAYMQAGEYRRAVAFVAHTASAHRDAPEGTALHAWLLFIGGQGTHAERILTDAEPRFAGARVLEAVRAQLQTDTPLALGALLEAPARMAPLSATRLPAGTRVTGSAVLLEAGRRAAAPLEILASASSVWLRNGLGQTVRAEVETRNREAGIAILRLRDPLPAGEAAFALRDPFPGSPAFAVEYVASKDVEPRWPLLRSGFVGAPAGGGRLRELGVVMPHGPRGGPVYDQAGRLTGIALPGDRLLPVSQLRRAMGASPEAIRSDETPARVSVDQIYEAALRAAVQVIVRR